MRFSVLKKSTYSNVRLAAYDPKDPGVLPSQATTKGQRVRLPGQTRVTPEEYKEFLCLGHGDIFQLDIDWYIPLKQWPPWWPYPEQPALQDKP